jgi:hypothetical protein
LSPTNPPNTGRGAWLLLDEHHLVAFGITNHPEGRGSGEVERFGDDLTTEVGGLGQR